MAANPRVSTQLVRASTPRKIPPLSYHKATDQAFVRLDGTFIYLGRWGQKETQENYERTVAEWLLGRSRHLAKPDEITVDEIVDRYIQYAATYYVNPDGSTNTEYWNVRAAMKPVTRLYGGIKAVEFGPLALRTVREQMVGIGWCRRQVNHQVGRVRRMFRWATENELVHGNVYHALQAVTALKRGRCAAKDNLPIRPVADPLVDAVQPFVSKQVWAMISIQKLTGARGGEICIMRPCDIDRSEEIWVYRPADHKTAYQGHERNIYIGPSAQKVLSPFLLRGPEEFCFSPKVAMRQWRKRRTAARVTPLCCGNKPNSNKKDEPRKQPSDRYLPGSYAHAVAYALKQAFPPPAELAKRDDETNRQWRQRLTPEMKQKLKAWHKQHHWHPHQLRHNAATELRKQFGLDVARIILGHRSVAVTTIYAEADVQKAIDVMKQVG